VAETGRVRRVDRALRLTVPTAVHSCRSILQSPLSRVLGVSLSPAQIVNYRSMGSTPIILAVGLALAAVVALGLTLSASVRRRKRDLALLKALGFTQRQLSAAVRLAGNGCLCRRHHRRDTSRHRRGTPPVDTVRRQYQRGAGSHRAGLVDISRRPSCSRFRQPRGGAPRSPRGAHSDRARPSSRVMP
jgi:hypothetical protein